MKDPAEAQFGPRQIFIAHEIVWQAIEEWAERRRMVLCRVPDLTEPGCEDFPTYVFQPMDPVR